MSLEFRFTIEQALSKIIGPDPHHPFSLRPVDISIKKVDCKKGIVELDIGECRFVEGQQLEQYLRSKLMEAIPILTKISIVMREI